MIDVYHNTSFNKSNLQIINYSYICLSNLMYTCKYKAIMCYTFIEYDKQIYFLCLYCIILYYLVD